MARKLQQTGTGFAFNFTDVNTHIFPPKDAVHDSLAWDDLDGDGCIDFIAISTASGNYDDTDHEVVGVHVPTGNVVWRALRGEASKKMSLVDGVLIVSTNTGQGLRGLDPRSGTELWRINLDDKIKEDPFDGHDRAPAIAGIGQFAAYECVDDTAHVIEAKTGRLLKTVQGELRAHAWNLPGLVAFKTENKDGDEVLDFWNIAHGRSIYTTDASSVRTLHGSGNFALMHRSEGAPGGGYAAKVTVFDSNSHQTLGIAWLAAGEGEDTPRHGDSEYGVVGGFMLAGNRVAFGYRYDEGASYLGQLVPNKKTIVQPWAPPKPGFVFRSMVWCAPAIVSCWQKHKGTEKLIVVGHDPNSMAPVWTAEDLGGRSLDNVLHTTGTAVLVPRSNDNYYNAQTNPCCMVHLDPATGAKVTEYPLENVDCVSIHGPFLCGAPDYFSGGVPTAYDTNKRERVL